MLCEVELRVGHIVLGIVSLAWTHGLEVFGRYTSPDLTCRNLRVLEHEGSCSYDRAFAHFATVEQRSAHADESMVVDGTGMYGHIMSDGDIRADMCGACVESDVDAAAVLDVRTVADGDGGYVATNDGIEPHGALVTHRHVADNRGVLTEITVSPPFGSETTI